ncbi:efflux RND transporter permease subunit [Primorskyibacter sp. 2E233]|uniref:efflux RND transporter permease subunit n=1 Tax=Primorskyibacter sp. 2E233 TaxID=3413431 RepID=UPI003BF442B2
MNISTWSIRSPVVPVALFLVLVVAGMFGFRSLPVTDMPNVDIPVVSVSVTQAGASPSEIVNQIIKPIEDVVTDVTGVDTVNATATDGSASIVINFDLEVDFDRAVADIKDAVSKVRSDLPDGILEPQVTRVDVIGAPILSYAISDPTRSIEELSYFADDVVARDVGNAEGVGKVERIGGADRAIEVALDPDRLLALGLTASTVNNQIRQANVNLGGGSGSLAGQEYAIRALGSADSIEALAKMPIPTPAGSTVRLGDLGRVIDGAEETNSFALLDGGPVVAIGVYRASGASDLIAGNAAKEKIAELSQAYPDVTFSLIDDATVYTEGSYHAAMDTLYEGAFLAVFVVFLFLRNWRATIITALALPLSIIPTFIVMNMLGFSLNTVSLLGITLVTGILVDDAIVEIENIVRHIHMGKPAYEASEEAAGEIGMTVIAISFTIVAVFAPVSFMSGIGGQFFEQFGLTVAVAVLFSLLVARLITPMLAAYFLRDGLPAEEEKDGLVMRLYMRMLNWTLRNRVVTLIAGLLIFAASIFSASLLPSEFVPASDTGRTIISVEMPPGVEIADMRETAGMITARVEQVPEVRSVFVSATSATKARVTVNFGQKDTRERGFKAIEADIHAALQDVPDVRLIVSETGQRDVILNILGDSQDAVVSAAAELANQIEALPELTDAQTDAALVRPEIRITPRPEQAAELGVTASALASTIRIATLGETGANAAKFNAGDRQIPIVVRMKEEVRDNLVLMRGQRIPSSFGMQVPLEAVADISLSSGASTISRVDGQYNTTVSANLANGAILGPATEAIYALPAAQNMPDGTEIDASGDAKIMADIFGQFALAMIAGILLVYVVLVVLFKSFVTPVTILLSLPLAIGGAIFALYLTDNAIGLSVIIGFLMLMGIVTKNAIMLVEFALDAMSNGVQKSEAMLDACHKRARPIIMTTIAMTAGMVPSALALGTGGEFRAPMAIAVIGGLLLSTMLSLVFVPSLFSVIDGGRGRSLGFLVRLLKVNKPAEA